MATKQSGTGTGLPLVLVLLSAACGGPSSSSSRTPTPAPTPALFVGARDISTCANDHDAATAAVLDQIFPPGAPLSAGVVATFGDNAYDIGSPAEYANCYDPTWGRHKARTRPAPGNHEYVTPGAAGYFGYFGAAAGDPARGYYSYEHGAWHVVVLNSNCEAVGGCGAGSPQETWLRADLAAHPTRCALAYWHHPRFCSSSVHGSHPFMRDLWQTLAEGGVDVALAGHDHLYERFASLNADGAADPLGLRSFVVGTGGRSQYTFGGTVFGSEVRDGSGYGVIKLTLDTDRYSWQFIPAAGTPFTDSGADVCH
jgi:acid phosphatase type 7